MPAAGSQAAEPVVKTYWVLVLGVGLAAQFAAAQTYTVPEEGAAANKCMYRLRLEGRGYVRGTAFSADGKNLYLRTDDQAINVWGLAYFNLPGGERKAEITPGGGFPIVLCECRANSARAVYSESAGFEVLELQTGRWSGRLQMPAGSCYDNARLSPDALSPDGRYFAASASWKVRQQVPNPAPELVTGSGISMLVCGNVWTYVEQPEVVVFVLSALEAQAP